MINDIRQMYRAMPDLVIRRRRPKDTLARALGFGEITFESEEFGRKFAVGCSDRKFAYDVISPAMMGFLLGDNAPEIEMRSDITHLTEVRQ